jgi:transmembrane sensor
MADDGDRRRAIAAVASDWHVRMAEPASEAEVEAFETWLSSDPDHARAYASIDAIAHAGAQLPRRMLAAETRAERRRWMVWALRPAMAVSLAGGVVAVTGFWFYGSSSDAAHAALSNDGPAIRAFRLSDGSAVILDRRTALDVTIGATARHIVLHNGRARFRVSPLTGRPFRVVSGDTTVTASGTLFDVSRDGRDTLVVALEGQVSVTAGWANGGAAPAMMLNPGEAAGVTNGRVDRRRVDDGMTRWPDGRLAFTDTPLSAVVLQANRNGRPVIVFADPALGQLRVTAVLDLRDGRALARTLAVTFGLTTHDDIEMITIGR